jgi:hypothetical protein
MDEIIHDDICKLVHKKFHPKSDHNDIKYHMTLNIKFNVVTPNFSYPGPSTNLLLLLKLGLQSVNDRSMHV